MAALNRPMALVELPLGGLVGIVGGIKLAQFRLLIGKGLGRADSGQPGLNVGIDDGGLLLDPGGSLTHGAAAPPHHQEKDRQNQGNHQSQPPLNGEENDEGTHNGHTGNEDILRTMVGQFRNIKEVRRQPAHQLPGAIAVKIVKGQLLHVAKQIPADICFHQDAEGMPPISNDVGKDRPRQRPQTPQP